MQLACLACDRGVLEVFWLSVVSQRSTGLVNRCIVTTGGRILFEYPKSARLISSKDFDRLFSSPSKKLIRSGPFQMWFEVSAQCGPRLGVIVAKRYLVRSCDRNLVKRLMRERFRHVSALIDGYDIVIRLAASPRPLDRIQMARDLVILFDRFLHRISPRPVQ